jgi:SAM-dependent methyltransferase
MSAAPAAASTGVEFEDEDVVAAYAHRTAYPPSLYDRLLDLTPGRGRVLDLGCGPGKLSRALAPHFGHVLAVDPSAAMLRLGQALEGGAQLNITWAEAKAEDVDLAPGLDLVVAGASIHWMDAPQLFPRLAQALAPTGLMARIDGDGPAEAPWIEAWQGVVVDWVGRMGGVWNDAAHRTLVTAHEPWFDVAGQETFTAPVVQSVDDLIEAEHSRATWARAKMGARAADFDADLRAVLAPYVQDGAVAFEVQSRLAWGRPRATAR